MPSLVVIGGGAAGFFGALRAAECFPGMEICIVEKSPQILSKVRISGGGRCNVTHACFDPAELINYYPRGHKELRGPFSRFQPGDTFAWFEARGVMLKTEEDGRVFPVTDRSQTIIDCFTRTADDSGIRVLTRTGVRELYLQKDNSWELELSEGQRLRCDAVLLTTGSSEQVWQMLEKLGHTIVPPVPSLFTFNCRDPRIETLPGLVAPSAEVCIEGTSFSATGPVLITHWGFSGPGILKLSAWAARELASVGYRFHIRINWDGSHDSESLFELLISLRQANAKKQIGSFSPVQIPQRLWESLAGSVLPASTRWADIRNDALKRIADMICNCQFVITGKSTFKDEFVTAGGIDLKQVDFTSMESRKCPNLWFAGEVLNIDAVTGGFNFQAAWTSSWIAGTAIAERFSGR